jgi:dihydrofolate reductase
MSRVVLHMSMSLDGYVASERQHPGMLPEDDELVAWKLDRITRAGAHLMGRKSYEEMAGFWPGASGPYAAPMNDIPKIVFSHTLSDEDATWPVTRIVRGDLGTEISAIKMEAGPDVIAWGGATLAASLAAANLIDEYRLAVQPVAVGRGDALFENVRGAFHLDLVDAQSFPCGVVMHIYRPRPE